jgi:hypothetical protein
MMLHTPRSLGKIEVATPGTPVPITTDTTLRATIIRFSVFIGGTGKVYLGVQGMNKATGAGVIKEFWPTTVSGAIADELILEAPAMGSYGFFRLSDFYVDADIANEGLLVSYFVKESDRL